MDTALILKRIIEGAACQRAANVVRGATDLEARTVELSFSSETDQVECWYGIEVLGHDAHEVDLSRLNNGAPALWGHDWQDHRGVVESAWIGSDRVGRARVRFSRSAAGEQLLQDIADGIVTKVSVGYSVQALQPAGERDGKQVYRATAWTPFEISLVSVPADDAVGVGRGLEIPQEETPPASSYHNSRMMTKEVRNSMPNALEQHLRAASTAPGDIHTVDHNGDLVGSWKRTPASVGHHSIRAFDLKPFSSKSDSKFQSILPGNAAGKITKLDAALTAGSRYLAAGGNLIVVPDEDNGETINGILVFKRRDISFNVIDPARFKHYPDSPSADAVGADGPDVDVGPLPIKSAYVDPDLMRQFGFRIEVTRQQLKGFAEGIFSEAVMQSIAMGLAGLVDSVFLGAPFEPTAPAIDTYSLAKAAAAGCAFSDLRALVGRKATGATIDQGVLRVAGVPAELTPTTEHTVIGDFSRTAVAIQERIRLVVARDGPRSKNGGLSVTCWVSVQPLFPTTSALWRVAS